MHLVTPIDADLLNTLTQITEVTKRSVEQEVQVRLKAALTLLPLAGRCVVVHGTHLQILEDMLGGGSILNHDDLVKKVERLAGVSFLHCRLPFTPNQLEALAEKAARNGLTVEQLVERTAPRIYEHFFDLVARV